METNDDGSLVLQKDPGGPGSARHVFVRAKLGIGDGFFWRIRGFADRPLERRGGYSSRSNARGSTANARRAGIDDATKPSSSMVAVTPHNTMGSLGVAW